ncbi:AraC family transcriptional regulator [Aliiruegeria haliotis]|nr:AraC family transcriptional regulator [Aliiruegeria haliotis]
MSILRLKQLAEVLKREPAAEQVLIPILRSVGVSTTMLADPRCRISYRQEAGFVRRVCDALEDPLCVSRAALSICEADNLVAYVARSCETLEQAIVLASRYLPLADSDAILKMTTIGDGALVSVHNRTGIMDTEYRHREFLLFLLLARMRQFARTNVTPVHMTLRHDVRGHKAGLERLAGCPVHVEQQANGLMLSRAALDLPIPTADPELHVYLKQHGDLLLSDRAGISFAVSDQVEAELQQSLPGKLPTSDAIAKRIGMSRRNMARKLKEEHRSYRSILDDVRQNLAKTMMRDAYSLSEIAFLLDYADQSGFSTAFKRWTGRTPTEYRATQGE